MEREKIIIKKKIRIEILVFLNSLLIFEDIAKFEIVLGAIFKSVMISILHYNS